MRYTFMPLQREEAEAIATWRYEGPYAPYDGNPEGTETLLRRLERKVAAYRES